MIPSCQEEAEKFIPFLAEPAGLAQSLIQTFAIAFPFHVRRFNQIKLFALGCAHANF